MSKLDDIIAGDGEGPAQTYKEQIKALFTELVGEDENAESYHISAVGEKRNELRAELRAKINEL